MINEMKNQLITGSKFRKYTVYAFVQIVFATGGFVTGIYRYVIYKGIICKHKRE